MEQDVISLEIRNGAKQDADLLFDVSAPLPIARQ